MALEVVTAERELLDFAGELGLPALVAVCAGWGTLSARAGARAGEVEAVFGCESDTRRPMTTAAEVLRTRAARHRMTGRGPLEAARRGGALGAWLGASP